MQNIGAPMHPNTHKMGRQDSTTKKPSWKPTIKRVSLRSVLAWRYKAGRDLSSLTRGPSRCTHWLLRRNTIQPTWDVTPGRSWLDLKLLCRTTVKEKDSTPKETSVFTFPKQELGLLETRKTTATALTPESALVLEGKDYRALSTEKTRVEMRLIGRQITEIRPSGPWGTS